MATPKEVSWRDITIQKPTLTGCRVDREHDPERGEGVNMEEIMNPG
jgi:hypothetical protein